MQCITYAETSAVYCEFLVTACLRWHQTKVRRVFTFSKFSLSLNIHIQRIENAFHSMSALCAFANLASFSSKVCVLKFQALSKRLCPKPFFFMFSLDD